MAVETVGAGGGVSGRANTSMAPGPGNFESRMGRWYAARIPKTYQQRHPDNPERMIDVPFLDEKGKVVMQLDPAAVETISKMTDGKLDYLTVSQMPEAANEAKKQAEATRDMMSEFMKNMMEVQAEQAKQIGELTKVLAGNAKRGPGRPRKSDE